MDTIILGKKDDDFLYGWDVDFGSREEVVDSFLVSKYMITNCEFLDFVNEGGYENKEFWDEESWEWLQGENRSHPKFWVRDGEGYQYRAMFDQFDLPLDYPVEVNHYEAIAFCRYLGQKKGKKYGLMSEAQWHLASKGNNDIDNYNLNLHYQSPTPVGSIKTAHSDAGIYDLRGNVWEWLGDNLLLYVDLNPIFFTKIIPKGFLIIAIISWWEVHGLLTVWKPHLIIVIGFAPIFINMQDLELLKNRSYFLAVKCSYFSLTTPPRKLRGL